MRPLFLLIILFSVGILSAQQTSQFKPYNNFLFDGSDSERTTLFGIAYKDSERQHYSKDHDQLYSYWSKLLKENRAEDLLLEQIRLNLNPSDLAVSQTILASIYFSKQQYSEAYTILKQIDENSLEEKFLQEYYFKLGYLSLVNYRFEESLDFINKSLNQRTNNYADANRYYRGMSNYFLGHFAETAKDFESLKGVSYYQPYLPYYLTQIYFTQGKYDKVIQYGKEQAQYETTENIYEIEKLIGQSYFKMSDYRNALIHFNIYEKNVDKLNKEEFYQIAYTHYQLGEFAEAIPLFLEINNSDKELGQIVNYYLADCYLKTGEKQSALTAFKNVMTNNSDPELQAIAKMNFSKLSYELGNDRASIKTLTSYTREDADYQQAQDLLGDILLRSNDYETAMLTIEQLPSKSKKILEAYQSLAFKSALNSISDNDELKALTFFNISEETPGKEDIKLESQYWLARIYDNQGKESRSREYLNKVFANDRASSSEMYFNAKYLSAYQSYKEGNLNEAAIEFQQADQSYNSSLHSQEAHFDVLARSGDCMYLNNDYSGAKQYYQRAKRNENQNLDYVMFQLGNIEAAKGNRYEAILAMDDLVATRSNSKYVDDALYFNAQNYQALNKPIEALGEYKKIVDLGKDDNEYYVPALLRSALISYNDGDMKQSLEYYQMVFKSNASGAEKQQALKALEEIYVEDLNDPESYFDFSRNEAGLEVDDFAKDSLSYTVANKKFRDANYLEAIIGFDKYLSSFPKGYYASEAMYFRGESYSQMKEYSEALNSYQKSLQTTSRGKYYNEALKKAALIAFNHENDFESSAVLAKQALELNLSETERKDFFEIAVVSLYNSKNYSDLLTVSENMLQSKNLEDFEIAKVNFYKAKALVNLNQKDQAVMAFNKVVQYSKNNQAAEASFELAKIFFESDRLDTAESQALETTKRAANYPSWVAKSLILLSDIYLKKDDSFNATAAIDAVLENYTADENITAEAQAQKQVILEYKKNNSRIKEEGQHGVIELDKTKNN